MFPIESRLLQEVMALLGIAGPTSPASPAQPDFLSSHGSLFHVASRGAAGSSSWEQDPMLEEPSSTSSCQHSPQYNPGMSFAQSASAPGWEDDYSMAESSSASELAALLPQQAAIAQAVVTLLEGAGASSHLLVRLSTVSHGYGVSWLGVRPILGEWVAGFWPGVGWVGIHAVEALLISADVEGRAVACGRHDGRANISVMPESIPVS